MRCRCQWVHLFTFFYQLVLCHLQRLLPIFIHLLGVYNIAGFLNHLFIREGFALLRVHPHPFVGCRQLRGWATCTTSYDTASSDSCANFSSARATSSTSLSSRRVCTTSSTSRRICMAKSTPFPVYPFWASVVCGQRRVLLALLRLGCVPLDFLRVHYARPARVRPQTTVALMNDSSSLLGVLVLESGGAGGAGSSGVSIAGMQQLTALQARLSLQSARDIAGLRGMCQHAILVQAEHKLVRICAATQQWHSSQVSNNPGYGDHRVLSAQPGRSQVGLPRNRFRGCCEPVVGGKPIVRRTLDHEEHSQDTKDGTSKTGAPGPSSVAPAREVSSKRTI